MDSLRARNPFRYTTDPAEPPEYIDEQEQNALIETLAESDAASNALYKNIFLALLTAIASLYLFAPFLLRTTASIPIRALCLVSALFSLATVYDVPVAPAVRAHSRPAISRSVTDYGIALLLLPSSGAPHDRLMRKALEGVRKWMVLANASLCAVMLLYAFWKLAQESKDASAAEREKMSARLFVSPCVVALALALVARHELRPIDTASLKQARYNYKGA